MTESSLHRLLLDCGFRNLLWTPLRGQKWAVVGELDGGVEITAACTTGPDGAPLLHVPSASMRELLLEMLAQNGAAVNVRAMRRRAPEAPTWLPVAIGAGAVGFFAWVVAEISR